MFETEALRRAASRARSTRSLASARARALARARLRAELRPRAVVRADPALLPGFRRPATRRAARVLLFFAAVFGLVGRFFSSVTTIELSPGVAACATDPE
jgi:hypothetical protein